MAENSAIEWTTHTFNPWRGCTKVAAYPDSIAKETIADQFGIHPRGGSFGEDLGRLVGRGLVDGNRGIYRARDFLFAGQR